VGCFGTTAELRRARLSFGTIRRPDSSKGCANVRSLLTDIEAKPASPNRILLSPSDDGWRGTIHTPNEEITVEAPTFGL
jgi:hypothetical protein